MNRKRLSKVRNLQAEIKIETRIDTSLGVVRYRYEVETRTLQDDGRLRGGSSTLGYTRTRWGLRREITSALSRFGL